MPTYDVGGLRLFYIDEPPSGPDRDAPILLIHGFASNHGVNWVFPQWVKALTGDGRRVIHTLNELHHLQSVDPALVTF